MEASERTVAQPEAGSEGRLASRASGASIDAQLAPASFVTATDDGDATAAAAAAPEAPAAAAPAAAAAAEPGSETAALRSLRCSVDVSQPRKHDVLCCWGLAWAPLPAHGAPVTCGCGSLAAALFARPAAAHTELLTLGCPTLWPSPTGLCGKRVAAGGRQGICFQQAAPHPAAQRPASPPVQPAGHRGVRPRLCSRAVWGKPYCWCRAGRTGAASRAACCGACHHFIQLSLCRRQRPALCCPHPSRTWWRTSAVR